MLSLTSLLTKMESKVKIVSFRGGFITYVVWDKVPGEPLNAEEFWGLDLESRQAIRDKFREAFP